MELLLERPVLVLNRLWQPVHTCSVKRALKLLWVECGLADEFHLQWGARRLSSILGEHDIAHTHVEHPAGHRGIDERYGEVVAALAGAL